MVTSAVLANSSDASPFFFKVLLPFHKLSVYCYRPSQDDLKKIFEVQLDVKMLKSKVRLKMYKHKHLQMTQTIEKCKMNIQVHFLITYIR